MAKINIQKAMTEYAEELEMMNIGMQPKVGQPKVETDPLWNTWYQQSYYYEPTIEMDIKSDEEITTTTTENTKMPINRKDRKTRANRRRQTFYHKRKMQRNAEIILDNYCKRSEEDMNNGAFCKKRGGHRVNEPKSLTYQAEAILKRAEKMQLIVDEPEAEDTQIVVNTDIQQPKAA